MGNNQDKVISGINNLILRDMVPDDVVALSQIYLTTRRQYFSWLRQPKLEDFQRASKGETVRVAVINDEIVGFASLSEWDSFLHLLFVKVGWHGQGIGEALLSWARQKAHHPLELKVVLVNQAARRFYEREGFKIVSYSKLAKPENVTYRDDRKS